MVSSSFGLSYDAAPDVGGSGIFKWWEDEAEDGYEGCVVSSAVIGVMLRFDVAKLWIYWSVYEP